MNGAANDTSQEFWIRARNAQLAKAERPEKAIIPTLVSEALWRRDRLVVTAPIVVTAAVMVATPEDDGKPRSEAIAVTVSVWRTVAIAGVVRVVITAVYRPVVRAIPHCPMTVPEPARAVMTAAVMLLAAVVVVPTPAVMPIGRVAGRSETDQHRNDRSNQEILFHSGFDRSPAQNIQTAFEIFRLGGCALAG